MVQTKILQRFNMFNGKGFNPYSAGIDFSCQNQTSVDFRL